MDLIWVCVYGGVIGFEPEEIAAFEREYRQNANRTSVDFWNCFNWHFREVLSGNEALCFSSLWTKPSAWKRLNELSLCTELGRHTNLCRPFL